MDVSLGIDIGTGSTKAGLVDADGRLVATGRSRNTIVSPRPGWSETDPWTWLDSAAEAVVGAMQATDRPSQRPVAVGFSGQMHGVVVCDQSLRPLRPAVLWSDARARTELAALRSGLSPDGWTRLGNPLVPGMAGPIMAALRHREPDVADAARYLLQPKDWVRAQLTGVVATDPSDASATLLWDWQTDDWSPAACEAFGVGLDTLAPVLDSDDGAGPVTAKGLAMLGLSAGPDLPVAVGAADTAAALLGSQVSPGRTQVSIGTGAQVATVLTAPVVDPSLRTHLFRTVSLRGQAKRWYAMGAVQNAGLAIDWALDRLGATSEEAGMAVPRAPIGSNGVVFLPYLTGERTPHLNGDLAGSWHGLRSSTSRHDLIRSVFEGVVFAMADALQALLDAGHEIDEALLAGGGSSASWWRRMVVDGLGITLRPQRTVDASVRGAGLLAWSSVGHDITAAPASVSDLDSTIESEPGLVPNPANVDAYRQAHARFVATAARMVSSGA